jgi:biopolymer transport protein ExbD
MRPRYHVKKDFRLELTPLIDIVFILLIFFAVSTTLITNNKGLPLDLPQAASAATQEPGIVISVDKSGQIFIDQQAVLIANVEPILVKKFTENPEYEVILNADQSLQYELIVSLLDKARLAGAKKISLQAEKTIIKT